MSTYVSSYSWHPLYKYIWQVKKDYFQFLDEAYQQGLITEESYTFKRQNYVFKDWLESIEFWSITQKGYPHPCTAVFSPLLITQDGYNCLFKYKKYIELNDLGFDFNTFFDLYDGLYLECRSVVFNIDTMEIILAPQAKFKNLDESYEWSMDVILTKLQKNSNRYFITNKMDGSNQNFCYNSLRKLVYGSGSQALDERESWRLAKGKELFKANIGYERLLREFPDTTFMFEFCSPDNPVVVRYTKEQEGLYLFGARDNKTGSELEIAVLQEYAEKYNVPMVEIYYDKNFEDILNETKNYTCNEKEGWVISIYDDDNYESSHNVFKVKLKVDDYILMHKVITSLVSPNELIKVIASDNYDDFYSKVPESHKELVNKIAQEILFFRHYMFKKALYQYNECMDEVNVFLTQLNIEYCGTGDVENNKKLMTKKFMIVSEEKCDKDVRGICRAIFLNHFCLDVPREIDVLHNCRDEEHGRSYKKIEFIRAWNKKYIEEHGEQIEKGEENDEE